MKRGKVFGLIALASGSGSLLAGLVGGPIAERWGFPMLFVVMAAATVVMLVIATFIQDKQTPHKETQLRAQEGGPAGVRSGPRL